MGALHTVRNVLLSAIAATLFSHSPRAQTLEELLKKMDAPIEAKISDAHSYDDLVGIKYQVSTQELFSSDFIAKAKAKKLDFSYVKDLSPLFLNSIWMNADVEDFEALIDAKVPKSYIEQLYRNRDVKRRHSGKDVALFYRAGISAEFLHEIGNSQLEANDITHLHAYEVPSSFVKSFRSIKGYELRFSGKAIEHFWSRNIAADKVAGFLASEKPRQMPVDYRIIAASIEAKLDPKFVAALSAIHKISFEDIKIMSEDKISSKYALDFMPNDFSFTMLMAHPDKMSLADTMYVLHRSKVTPEFQQRIGKMFTRDFGHPVFAAWDLAYLFETRNKHKDADIKKALALFDGKSHSSGAAVTCLLQHNLVPDFTKYLASQGKKLASTSDLDAFTYERNRAALKKAGYLRDPDNNSTRPKAIFWMPRSDWNCAFYHPGIIQKLDEIRKHFDTYVTFAANPDKFKQYQLKFTSYDLLIDAGHGSQGTISKTEQDLRLHDDKGTKGAIRMNDPVLRQYYSKLSSSGTHILYACSNAEGDDNLANTLARANRGVRVIAATSVSYRLELSFSPLNAQHYGLRGRDITKVIQH